MLSVLYSFSQNGVEVYQFMNFTTSARQAALGGNIHSAWDSDPNLALWNPGLMNEKMIHHAGINYSQLFQGTSFGTLSYVLGLDEQNYLGVHARYLDYGKLTGTDTSGNLTGDFRVQDAAFTLGYAHNINDFFTVGVNVSYVSSRIENYRSSAILADLGVVFHDIDYDTNVSLVVRNLGSQIEPFESREEKMPFQVNLGFSRKLEEFPIEISAALNNLQQWDISEPVNQQNQQPVKFGRKLIDHLSVGAELFPERGFNLRVGYNFKRGNELRTEGARSFAGLTFGLGLRISSLRFEFAHSRFHNAGHMTSFGLRINVGEIFAKRYSWQ